MKRLQIQPRKNWQKIAEENGFFFHHVDGSLYWDESAYYTFTLKEIEDNLEDPANEIHAMCLELVDEAVRDETILSRLKIPEKFWDPIADSWKEKDKNSFYGRFDFSYNGKGSAKLLEYNADTPTSLYESAYFQWLWLEDQIINGLLPENADQFNSIQEKLIEAMGKYAGSIIHFACVKDSEEDRGTVEYMMDCAVQAGIHPSFIYMEDIGSDELGDFFDLDNLWIENLFKLYPWEYIWKDKFGEDIVRNRTKIIEPAWKMVLSNKGILPLLWERYPHHPNLLEAHFDAPESLKKTWVRKPLLSREGSNISIFDGPETCGEYGAEGYIWQDLCLLPNFYGRYPVCGVWIANNMACGLGIREDDTLITRDTSRFVPHIIEG